VLSPPSQVIVAPPVTAISPAKAAVDTRAVPSAVSPTFFNLFILITPYCLLLISILNVELISIYNKICLKIEIICFFI
jgi:hypothetical protein